MVTWNSTLVRPEVRTTDSVIVSVWGYIVPYLFSPVADDNAAVYEVFRAHFDQLVRAVTHPTTLITMLYSKKLISDTDKTKIFTAPTDDLDKATRLMNAVEATMKAATKASQVLLELCEAVADEPALKLVADNIKSALGEMIRSVP